MANRIKLAFSPHFLASLVVSGSQPDPSRRVARGLVGPVDLVECELQKLAGGHLLFLTFEGPNVLELGDSPTVNVVIYEPMVEGGG